MRLDASPSALSQDANSIAEACAEVKTLPPGVRFSLVADSSVSIRIGPWLYRYHRWIIIEFGMETTIVYRRMQAGEESIVCNIVARVFKGFVEPGFSSEGIQEFLRYVEPGALAQRAQADHFVWVAVAHDEIVGMVEVRDHNHVSLFFVDARYHRRGIGRELIQRALDTCRHNRQNLQQIDVNSSPYAVPVYQKLGFRQTGAEQVENGIRFIPMVLELRQQ
jgi:GNAT superfamily N-acetyltransferase